MPEIRSLCVLFDASCGVCTGVRDWLIRQHQAIPLQFIASGSVEAVARYPSIEPGELAVVADTGEVWIGNHAWIVCLWALRDYRAWAGRFSSPLLLPLAREAFAALSRNRGALSRLMGAPTDEAMEKELRTILVTGCENKQE